MSASGMFSNMNHLQQFHSYILCVVLNTIFMNSARLYKLNRYSDYITLEYNLHNNNLQTSLVNIDISICQIVHDIL